MTSGSSPVGATASQGPKFTAQDRMPLRVLGWRTESLESADLAAGLRAARALQRVPVPPVLSKQLANYALRVATELASRNIDPDRLIDDGSET